VNDPFPHSIDRMPPEHRKPRAGPILDPDEVIASSLNSVSYEWWKTHKNTPPLSETSEPVLRVIEGLRLAGYKIVAS
jgi:hypothetical protein